MKPPVTVIKHHLLLSAIALLCVSAVAQERPDADRIRREAQDLSEKARDLKANGDLDGAEKLGRAAKDLQRLSEQLEPKPRSEGSAGPDTRRQPRPEGEQQRNRRVPPGPQERELGRQDRRPDANNEPRERLEDRRSSDGRDRDQRSEGLRIERRESRRIEGGSDRLQGGDRPFRPGERFDGAPGPRAEQFDLALRRYHVRRAIWHLHAAGLHAQADRLQERLEQAIQRYHERRQDWRRGPQNEPRSDRRSDPERNERP